MEQIARSAQSVGSAPAGSASGRPATGSGCAGQCMWKSSRPNDHMSLAALDGSPSRSSGATYASSRCHGVELDAIESSRAARARAAAGRRRSRRRRRGPDRDERRGRNGYGCIVSCAVELHAGGGARGGRARARDAAAGGGARARASPAAGGSCDVLERAARCTARCGRHDAVGVEDHHGGEHLARDRLDAPRRARRRARLPAYDEPPPKYAAGELEEEPARRRVVARGNGRHRRDDRARARQGLVRRHQREPVELGLELAPAVPESGEMR